MATIEFARHMAGVTDATSSEFDDGATNPVIDMMETQRSVQRKGGSMRLGAYPCMLKENTLAQRAYQGFEISERHRHRYEFNNAYREKLEKAGLIISGTSPNNELVEIIEVCDHPWFIGVQFHPEFKSTPRTPHPLFRGFVGAALAHRIARETGTLPDTQLSRPDLRVV
jgi:CTP synthase